MMTRDGLSTRVFHRWLIPALAEWVAIGCLFALGFAADHFIVWALVTFFLGSRMHGLGILGHDGAHFAAAGNRTLNDLATDLLCFWPLFTSLDDFRRFHLAHHHNFGDPKADPELLFKHTWSRSQWALPTTRARILTLFVLDVAGFGLIEVMKMLRLVGKMNLRSWLGPVLWWAVVGGVLYGCGLGFAFVIWVVAFCTSFWAFYRMRMWTEHIGTESTHRLRANWWQQIIVTPHGSWSHFEHHAHPSVPFWRRPELREEQAVTVSIGELFRLYATLPHGSGGRPR